MTPASEDLPAGAAPGTARARPRAASFGLGAALVGAGLLGGYLLSGGTERAEPPTVEPEWMARAPRLAQLSAMVETVAPDRPLPSLADLLAAERRRLSDLGTASSRWQMTRVLPRGYEFDAPLALTLERLEPPPGEGGAATPVADDGPGGAERVLLSLRIERPGVEPLVYQAQVDERGIGGFRYAAEGGEAAPVEVRDDLPLSVGDLRVRDVVELWRAVRAGEERPLGTLSTYNSVVLAVYEVPLVPPTAAETGAGSEGSAEAAAHGTLALVYADAESRRLRTVRIFDAVGRLLRTYRSLAPAGGDEAEGAPLEGFAVDSVPTESSSIYRLEALDLSAG